MFGFVFFHSATQVSFSDCITFASAEPINVGKDDRRGWLRTYDLSGEVWWPTLNVPSQHMLGITKWEVRKTSIRMAAGRVRTYHLTNAKPTLFRTSAIVTGLQQICCFFRLVYLYKSGKESSLKSEAFVIRTGESRPGPSLKAPSQLPVRYTHQVSPSDSFLSVSVKQS